MKTSVSRDIFNKFPNYIRVIVIARGIENSDIKPDLISELESQINETKEYFTQNELTTHPSILKWREAYKLLGEKSSQFYSSVEALARRARRGDTIPYINTLVTVMNLFSLKNLIPCGGDDIDHVSGDITLRFAEGNEVFIPFNSIETESPAINEIIYVDNSKNVLCRRWNWRQGNNTKISLHSSNVLVNIDCLPPVTHELAEVLGTQLTDQINKYCVPNVVNYHLVHENNPVVKI